MKPFLFFYLTRKGLRLFFLLSAIFLAACGTPEEPQPDEVELPFETIEQDDWGYGQSNYGDFNEQAPAIFAIIQPTEISQVATWVKDEALIQLETLDYQNAFAIVVFQGLKGSDGYGVRVEQVVYQTGVVKVYTQFKEPPPETPVRGVETSPYHLIQVQKPPEWVEGAVLHLVVNGEVVATYPPALTPTPVMSPYPMPPTPRFTVSPYPIVSPSP